MKTDETPAIGQRADGTLYVDAFHVNAADEIAYRSDLSRQQANDLLNHWGTLYSGNPYPSISPCIFAMTQAADGNLIDIGPVQS